MFFFDLQRKTMFQEIYVVYGVVFRSNGISSNRNAIRRRFHLSKESTIQIYRYECCSDQASLSLVLGVCIKTIQRISSVDYCHTCQSESRSHLCSSCLNRIRVDLEVDRYMVDHDLVEAELDVERIFHDLVTLQPQPSLSASIRDSISEFVVNFPDLRDQTPAYAHHPRVGAKRGRGPQPISEARLA